MNEGEGLIRHLIHLVFPPRCIFCGEPMAAGTVLEICSECYDRLPFLKHKFYPAVISDINQQWCDSVMCLFHYSGSAKELLKRFKYHKKPGCYRAVSELLARQLEGIMEAEAADMVASVPLYTSREAARGYNQSLLLSRALSKRLGITEISRLLTRIRDTGSQSLLGRDARHFNVKDAFVMKNPQSVTGRNILLVDDIITTGSTLNECARMFKMAGAKHVMAVAVASGRKDFV